MYVYAHKEKGRYYYCYVNVCFNFFLHSLSRKMPGSYFLRIEKEVRRKKKERNLKEINRND